MKSRLIIIILLVFSLNSEAQVRRTTIRAFWQTIRNTITGETPQAIEKAFYVSSTGSDSNPGTLAEPFQTLDKINSLALTDTSKVYLKRGDSFVGSLTAQSDSIIYDAYGTGDKPKIYGSELITGWTLHSGNIWKATFNTTINQLFVNGVRMQVARYPETGYATVDAAPTTSSLTDAALNGALDYTGTICLIHSDGYALDRRTVTSSSGTTLQLSSAPFGNVTANEKYILVGKLEFLTVPGQWFYDDATNTVYLWKADGTEPTDTEVRGSTLDYGIYADGKDYVNVKNIEVLQQKKHGVYFTNSDYFAIDNIKSTDADAVGIRNYLGHHGTIENCTITGANHYGIENYASTGNCLISSNTVSDIALPDNLGLSGIGAWYNGAGIFTQNSVTTAYNPDQINTIRYNRVDSIGYNGIHFANEAIVEYNYITNCGFTKNDGGFVYTSGGYPPNVGVNANSIIRYNIGLYGYGIGSSPYFEGMYADEYSENVTIEYNTVGYSTRGLFFHNGNNNIGRYNTVFGCENGLYVAKDGEAVNLNNNLVYGLLGQEVIHTNIVTGAMSVDYNNYINHYTSNPFFKDFTNYFTFANWKSTTGFDTNSTFDNTALSGDERLIINPTNTTKTFYLNAAIDVINEATDASLTGSFTIAAYSSMIVTGVNLDCILDYEDSEAPIITAFTLPATSSTLSITPTTLTATGGATEYKTTLTNVAPAIGSSGWSTESLIYAEAEGTQTFYVWARDAAGNVSESASATCNVSGTSAAIGTQTILSLTSGTANAVRAYPVTMTESGLINSITIYHSAGNGTEQIIGGIYADTGSNTPGELIATTAQTVITTSTEWQTIDFVEPVYVEAGTKIWIGWNKNGASTLAYEAGSVTRASKNVTFGALPNPYGTADTYQNYGYSVYVNYLK